MKVTIWDLDYYFSDEKGAKVNVDVQKISSYHKQKGDRVNFVTSERDIHRPYDIYYIVKENKNTPNPPIEFFMDPKVKWWGEAYVMKQNWKMSDAMLACRPDYLLYPERLSRDARAEQIRLLGNNNKLLPVIQDWGNTLKDKNYIVTDKKLWYTDEQTTIAALQRIQGVPNICFEAPIPIMTLKKHIEVLKEFWKLKFTKRSQIEFVRVFPDEIVDVFEFIVTFKSVFPNCPLPHLKVIYSRIPWKTTKEAQEGMKLLRAIVVTAKRLNIYLDIVGPKKREETPFFFLPELMEEWCKLNFKMAWLEYLSVRFKVDKNYMSGSTDWNKPNKWHPLFRDAIRQTYEDAEFLLRKWGEERVSESEIPWKLWKETFKLGI